MEPVSGTGVVVIGGIIVVVGIGAWLIFRHRCRLVVSASPIHVGLYGTASITATLQRKGWLGGTWTTVTPATYTATGGSIAAATVTGSPTTAAATGATVTITGAATGSDTVKVTASGGDCTGVSGEISVTVP
jgi:hypothetical protein